MSRWNPFEEDDPLMGALSKKAAQDGFSLSGLITLTARCNLRCIHCYITPSNDKYLEELDTASFKRIFDEIADMGTLFLTLTGGEPMLRPDFKDLYRYARKRGFMLTLFSNATLIDDEVIAMLKEFPPRYIDISLYGATEKTYEEITGVKGSYKRCINGIESLLENNIKVHLKSVLMKPNVSEFVELKKMAMGYGVPYRVDQMVFGRFDGDKSPLDLRVSPELGVECEVQLDGFKESLKTAVEGKIAYSNKLYNCGAGRSTFSVTEHGILRPCLMITDIESDLKEFSFQDAWRQVRETVFSLSVSDKDKCKGCDLYAVCGYCPPMGKFSLKEGMGEKEYFCKIGRARNNVI